METIKSGIYSNYGYNEEDVEQVKISINKIKYINRNLLILEDEYIMLVDLVNKYYDKKYDLNCAECMLVAANEEYDLNISKQTLMTMASFGGGMAIGSVCGAATGAISVLALMFTNDRGHKSPHVKEMTSKFLNEFNMKMNSLDCISLKENYYDLENRCSKMMMVSAELLQEILNEYSSIYSINR